MASRLPGEVSATKALTVSASGIAPVRSSVMRRRSSSSVDAEVQRTLSFTIFPKISSSMKFFAVNVSGACTGGTTPRWREEAVVAGACIEGTTSSARSDNSWNMIAADRNARGLKLHSARASFSPALPLTPMARSTNAVAAPVRRARMTSS